MLNTVNSKKRQVINVPTNGVSLPQIGNDFGQDRTMFQKLRTPKANHVGKAIVSNNIPNG